MTATTRSMLRPAVGSVVVRRPSSGVTVGSMSAHVTAPVSGGMTAKSASKPVVAKVTIRKPASNVTVHKASVSVSAPTSSTGTGNVVGPPGAVVGDLAMFDNANGKHIADSGIPAIEVIRSTGGTMEAPLHLVGSAVGDEAISAEEVETLISEIVIPDSGGDVFGPSSSVDTNIAMFDGTTGKLIADSGLAKADIATTDYVNGAIAAIPPPPPVDDISLGQFADMPSMTVIGRNDPGDGQPEYLPKQEVKNLVDLGFAAFTGPTVTHTYTLPDRDAILVDLGNMLPWTASQNFALGSQHGDFVSASGSRNATFNNQGLLTIRMDDNGVRSMLNFQNSHAPFAANYGAAISFLLGPAATLAGQMYVIAMEDFSVVANQSTNMIFRNIVDGVLTTRLQLHQTGVSAIGILAATGTISGSNLSGTNTGDQTVNLTGDVTGVGTGPTLPTATTIANNAVTLAKMADMATASLLGRNTSGSGDPEVLSTSTVLSMLGITGTNTGDQTITLTGDVTGSGTGSFPTTISNNAVTLVKMADMATASLLGRNSSGTGDPEVLSTSTVLSMLGITGINTGDQTITLTGDVTGSGTGSFPATIGNNVVTLAKMADMAGSSFLGRNDTIAGDPEVLTVAEAQAMLGVSGVNSGDQTITLTGPVTGSGTGSFPTSITDKAITYAKLQDIPTDTLIGRDAGGTGVPTAIAVGGGIEFVGNDVLRLSAFTGDVTKAAGSTVTDIAAGVVGTIELANEAVLGTKLDIGLLTDNLVVNGNAEGGMDGWVQTVNNGGNTTVDTGSTNPFGAAFKQNIFTLTGGIAAITSRCFPVREGATYHVSFWAMRDVASTFGYFARVFFGSGKGDNYLTNTDVGYISLVTILNNVTIPQVWTYYEGVVTAPAGAKYASLDLYHSYNGQTAINSVFVGNIAVREQFASKVFPRQGINVDRLAHTGFGNLVPNPQFSILTTEAPAGTRAASLHNWTISGVPGAVLARGGSGVQATCPTAFMLQLTGNGVNTPAIQTITAMVEIRGGEDIYLSFMVAADVAIAGNLTCYCNGYTATGAATNANFAIGGVSVTSTWTRFEGKVTTPATMVAGFFQINWGMNVADSGKSIFLTHMSMERYLTPARLPAASAVFLPSGPTHTSGLVPDPGATAGTTKFLREDATWGVPSGTGTGVANAYSRINGTSGFITAGGSDTISMGSSDGSIGITGTEGTPDALTFVVNQGVINHGNLTGIVADQHIAHSTIDINAGTGLLGGGTIAADVTLSVDTSVIATVASLASYAPIASPLFTGDPRGPTPATSDNDTSLATTAYVKANLANYAPLVHVHVIADTTGLQAALDLKAPLASPVLSGDPKAPTPATADNDTSIATTAYVKANLANYQPSGSYAPLVHTHVISDTTGLQSALDAKAPLASPVFTGNPTAPNATLGDNDTTIANTAFVQAEFADFVAAPNIFTALNRFSILANGAQSIPLAIINGGSLVGTEVAFDLAPNNNGVGGRSAQIAGVATVNASTTSLHLRSANGAPPTDRVIVGHLGGTYSVGATGGDKGANSLNFTTIYEAGTLLSAKYANITHVHTIANVTGLQAALDGKQPLDAELTTLASSSPFFLTLSDDADAAAARTTLGLGSAATHDHGEYQPAGVATGSYQPLDAMLSSLAGLTGADNVAGRLPYLNGVDTLSTVLFSAFGKSFVGADAATAKGATLLNLAPIASSGSASDLQSGTVPVARLPAFTGGDVTAAAGSTNLQLGAGVVGTAELANSTTTTDGVTFAKIQKVAGVGFLGRNDTTPATGNIELLTKAEAQALLNGEILLADPTGVVATDSANIAAWWAKLLTPSADSASLRLPRGRWFLNKAVTVTVTNNQLARISIKGLSRYTSSIVCVKDGLGDAGSLTIKCIGVVSRDTLIDISDFAIEPGEAGVFKLLDIEYPVLGKRANANFSVTCERMNFCPADWAVDYSAVNPLRFYGVNRLRLNDVNVSIGRDASVRAEKILNLEETYQAKLTKCRISGDGDYLIYKFNKSHTEGFIINGCELVGCDTGVYIKCFGSAASTTKLGNMPGLEISNNRIASSRRCVHVAGMKGSIVHNDLLSGPGRNGTYVRSGSIYTCTMAPPPDPQIKHWFATGSLVDISLYGEDNGSYTRAAGSAVISCTEVGHGVLTGTQVPPIQMWFSGTQADETFSTATFVDANHFTVSSTADAADLVAADSGTYTRTRGVFSSLAEVVTRIDDYTFTVDVASTGLTTTGTFIIDDTDRPFEYIGVQATNGMLIESNVFDGASLQSSRACDLGATDPMLPGETIDATTTGVLVVTVGMNSYRYDGNVPPVRIGIKVTDTEIEEPCYITDSITATTFVEKVPGVADTGREIFVTKKPITLTIN